MRKFIIDEDLDIFDNENLDLKELKKELNNLKLEVDWLRTEIYFLKNRIN